MAFSVDSTSGLQGATKARVQCPQLEETSIVKRGGGQTRLRRIFRALLSNLVSCTEGCPGSTCLFAMRHGLRCHALRVAVSCLLLLDRSALVGAVVGQIFYAHTAGSNLGDPTALAPAFRDFLATSPTLGAPFFPAGSTSCVNTADLAEARMGLSDSGTTVSWACYMAPVGSLPIPSATRGINVMDWTSTIMTVILASGAYVGGVIRAAVSDDAGGFYVSGLSA